MIWHKITNPVSGLVLFGALGWFAAWATQTPYAWPIWTVGLFAVALVLRILWLTTTTCRRSGPEDTLVWRGVRAAILSALSPVLSRNLTTREINEPRSHYRLLSTEADQIIDRIEPMAMRLRQTAALQNLPSFGNRLMVELAIFTTAAYRVLLDTGAPPAIARGIVADTGWTIYSTMLRLTSLPYRWTSRDPAKRLQRTIRTLLWFPFDAAGAPGYAVETREHAGGIDTYFTHCPPQTFVRNLIHTDDRGDLAAFQQSWCRYDWPGADIIAGDGSRGHYARPHTLSFGDGVCDMCWQSRATGQSAPQTLRPDPQEKETHLG